MSTTPNKELDWTINSDVYNILESINNLKSRYIDEDETTLSLGIFGFTSDLEAKKIQTATIVAGQLGNEMFPTRAILMKNVLTHAIYNGIEGVNAVPAHMTASIGLRLEDLDSYWKNNEFILDANSPIFVGDYEFHFDFDVLIKRKQITTGYSYSAQYIMSDDNGKLITNRLSNLVNPYLKHPLEISYNGYKYLVIQAVIRQVTIEETVDTMVSESIIENKSYTFQFANQIADFQVFVEDNGVTTELTPFLYGSNSNDVELYCWYLFIAEDTIRITFDSKSFIPGLNSKITIKAYTTLGSGGNFEYAKIDATSEGFYVELSSDIYNYSRLIAFLIANTDSTDGVDKKTKEQLQKLIPKAAIARGSITTESDVNNYFNMINTEENRLVMMKKEDNQLSRIWYAYFILKDLDGNIIPTNTINLRFNTGNVNRVIKSDDGRWILPAGTYLKYDALTKIAEPIDESEVPNFYSNSFFGSNFYYYNTLYDIVINNNPLYAAYYLTICNLDSYFTYNFANDDCDIQFITNRFHFERNLFIDGGKYTLTFSLIQSTNDNEDITMYDKEEIQYDDGSTKTIITNNVKIILVLYKSGAPHRWIEVELNEEKSDWSQLIMYYNVTFISDNRLDIENNIKITNMHEKGSNTINNAYFGEDVEAKLYILALFPNSESTESSSLDSDIEYTRMDIDYILPKRVIEYTDGVEDVSKSWNPADYTLTNIYDCADGISFLDNFTDVINSRVDQVAVSPIDSKDITYKVSGVPVIGTHYLKRDDDTYTNDEEAESDYAEYEKENVKFLLNAINEKKAYIDYCLELLENNMNIDLKYFNTYGPSVTYTIDNEAKTLIGPIDITLKFKVSLPDDTDIYIVDDIKAAIKANIEDLYNTGDWHVSNLITYITNKFSDRINYFEYVGFNSDYVHDMTQGFDANYQHIIEQEMVDVHITPEFINVRNRRNPETKQIEPCIDIEIV